MLIGICGDYFNLSEIRHIGTKVEDDSEWIIVELKNGDFYDFEFNSEIYNTSISEYLKEIVIGANVVSGRDNKWLQYQ